MNTKVLKALQDFRDFMYCATGDFYYLHHTVIGDDFDSLHKVYKKYYEQAVEDFDNLSEWLVGFGADELNANGAENRIGYKSIPNADSLLGAIVTGMYIIYKAVDAEDNALLCGLAAELQGRLAYWGKEYSYFNARRKNSDGEIKQREDNDRNI